MNSCLVKILAAAIFLTLSVQAGPVSNVHSQQRWPWNGKVDIYYTLTKTTTKTQPVFSINFYCQIDNGAIFQLQTLSGDGASGIIFGDGQRKTTWDATQDLGTTVDSTNVKLAVVAEDITDTASFLKIDLTTYKITPSPTGPTIAPGSLSKYSELWLRRVDPGTFIMGSSTSEPGHQPDETEHTVTITQAFYIAIFELTIGQYDRIFSDSTTSTNTYPKNQISYEDLRGKSFPFK